MRIFSLSTAVFCTLMVMVSLCQAIEDDDFKELRDEMSREMSSFHNEIAADFGEFRDERDREFAEYLREQWEAFDEMAAEVSGLGPKPKVLPKKPDDPADKIRPQGNVVAPPPVIPPPAPVPVAPPITVVPPTPPAPPAPPVADIPSPPVPVKPPVPDTPPSLSPPVPVPAPEPVVPVTPLPVAPTDSQKLAQFDFYGQMLKFYYDPLLVVSAPRKIDNQVMSAVWADFSKAEVSALLQGFADVRRQWDLNDWGYYLLVRKFSGAVNKDESGSELLAWFLLVKSGYECRIAYNDADSIFLLAPVRPILYGVPYLTIDGTSYFNLTCLRTGKKAGRLYSYRQSHAASISSLDLALTKAPRLTTKPFTRTLKFDYAGTSHTVPVRVNRQVLNFFNDYPSTDFPVFFEAMVEPDSQSTLLTALAPLVAGKSETEAVNLLLRFVQTSFEYKTDDEQFGKEKYLFVEQTLFFPYCDCEDRSILFSYLVDHLVGLKTVGLLYPGHIAVGVQFNASVSGDSVLYSGERFVVCDPTYINADIGMAMPQFKKTDAEVIEISRPL